MAGLAEVLSHELLVHPTLLQELPGLISALDAGKQVVLDPHSCDPLQATIARILHELPTSCSPKSVWAKGDCLSLNRVILSHLLSSRKIVQPQELSLPERLAVKSSMILLRILETNHGILPDVVSLLENLLEGEGVDLSGLENPILKEDLTSFFHSLEIQDSAGGVFSLSNPRIPESKKAIKIVLSSLRTKPAIPIKEKPTIVPEEEGVQVPRHGPRQIGPSPGANHPPSIQVIDVVDILLAYFRVSTTQVTRKDPYLALAVK